MNEKNGHARLERIEDAFKTVNDSMINPELCMDDLERLSMLIKKYKNKDTAQ